MKQEFMDKTSTMQVGIHQLPKSFLRFLLLSFQHVLAMFGANILVPILVNEAAGEIVIPLQVAFFCSGIGTIIYLLVTSFKVPIYLGSSFAFLGGMTSLYVSSGFNVFFSLMIVGVVYVIVALIIWLTKSSKYIKKLLSPVIVGPTIMIIGLGLVPNAAEHSYLNVDPSNVGGVANLWALISIALVTFIIIIVCMIFLKGIWKILPFLLGIVGGILFSLIVWGIAKGVGNEILANKLYGSDNKGVETLLNPSSWKWYPDITNMWRLKSSSANGFKITPYLSLVPLAVVTLAEHIGDHINIGSLTGNDFITSKPGIYRTLVGDGLATIVSAACGGPANTSYGENTSVISITKVSSVWVIFGAAIMSIIISFIAPISLVLQALPQPIIGGIEIILYSMIAINGLRILINSKEEIFTPKNIILISILAICGLGGATFWIFKENSMDIMLSGTGVGLLICILLNILLPNNKDEESASNIIDTIDFNPSDFVSIFNFKKKNKKDLSKHNNNDDFYTKY